MIKIISVILTAVMTFASAYFSFLPESIDSAVSADPRRFYDEALYEAEFTDGENTLYGFIRQRCAFIDSQGE